MLSHKWGSIYVILPTPKSYSNLWKRDQKEHKNIRIRMSSMKGWLLDVIEMRNALHRFTYLNIWSTVSSTIWEGYGIWRRWRLTGEVQNWRKNLRFYSLTSHVLYTWVLSSYEMWSASSLLLLSCLPWLSPHFSHHDGM